MSAVLVLRGEPGIGKSALLEYAWKSADGLTVLRATGIEAEHELPFAGLHQLIRPCLEHLPALPDRQRNAVESALGLGSEDGGDRFLVSIGLLTVLAEAAGEAPLLCVVDDAQWLDRPSQDALAFAARRLQAESVAVLIAARDGDPRRFGGEGLPELRLGPLADEAARALLSERLERSASAHVVDALLESARGNPLALLELPVGLSERQLSGAEPLVGPPRARGVVEDEFRTRLEALPQPTRTALLVASADEVGDLATIAAACGRLGVALDELAAAEEAGLVQVEDPIGFRHPLARSAAYRSANREERVAAHHALAEEIDDPVRSIWHRAVIAERADEQLAGELEAAAAQANARGGPAAAAGAYERAAELSVEAAKRGARLVAAAVAAFESGRPDASLALIARARPLVEDPVLNTRLDLIESVDQVRRGSPEDAFMIQARVGEALSEIAPEVTAELCLWRTILGVIGGWPERAFRDSAERLAAIAADTVLVRFARRYVAAAQAVFDGEIKLARRRFDDAIAAAADLSGGGGALGLAVGPRLTAYARFFCGELTDARAAFGEILAEHRRHGSLVDIVGILHLCAVLDVMDGRYGRAEALVDEGAELATQLGFDNDMTGACGVRARIQAMRGRDAECREAAQETIRRSVVNGVGWAARQAQLALAELEIGSGDPRAALEHLAQLDRNPVPPISLLATPEIVDALVRAEETERAVAAVEEFERWAPLCRAELAQGFLARCKAMVADDPAEAERHYENALELHALVAPYHRARTQLAYGEWLRRERRKSEARTHLRSAADSFEGLKAAGWAQRAGGELRATGETARKRDVSTVDELTPQELRIAQLVAEGATNRDVAAQLFVSPKTVEYHLRKVFMKLDVTSRVELARVSFG